LRKLFVVVCVLLLSFLVSCSHNQSNSQEILLGEVPEKDKALVAKMALSSIGADLPRLAFASENIAVIHDYWGLIVYDLNEQRICRAVDLSAIGLNYTQGDDASEAIVNKKGTQALLRKIMNSQENPSQNYLYDIVNDKLVKTDIKGFNEGAADNIFDPNDENSKVLLKNTGIDSTNICGNFAKIENDKYVYLRINEIRNGEDLAYNDMRQLTLHISGDDSSKSMQVFYEYIN
jgi:hypothetical protein